MKRRQKPRKLIRKGLRQQLNYVRRNLGHIDRLIEAGATLAALNPREYKTLLVIHEVFRQQQHMYHHKRRRIEDRIVSISQPRVHPIVRGKAGTPVEFGAKFAISCMAGYVFLDETQQALLRQQVREDESVRVAVEGKFGLARVMAKLAQTAETMIAITCLVMNLEKRLRRFIVLLLRVLIRLLHGYQADMHPFAATLSDDWLKTLDYGQDHADHVWVAG